MIFSTVTQVLDESVQQQIDAAVLVRTWVVLPSQPEHECRHTGNSWWLFHPFYGAAHFDAHSRSVQQYVCPDLSTDEYQRMFEHEWLPIIYQAWGYFVLHAGAVTRTDGGTVLFVGTSGAGKSTLAFGLGQRPGWTQIADDSVALVIAPDNVEVVSLPNAIRLRPASTNYYATASPSALAWPTVPLSPRAIYLPEQDANHPEMPTIEALGPAQALNGLLDQLYVLDLDSRDVRHVLIAQTLDLISRIPVFRLRYRRDFAALETTLDGIEAHAVRL